MTLEEIRALLAAPEAWRPLAVRVDSTARDRKTLPPWLAEESAAYADERARTIAQALAAERAAVRELLVVVESTQYAGPCPCAMCETAARVRALFGEGS